MTTLAGAEARIFALRDRDHDARRAGAAARPCRPRTSRTGRACRHRGLRRFSGPHRDVPQRASRLQERRARRARRRGDQCPLGPHARGAPATRRRTMRARLSREFEERYGRPIEATDVREVGRRDCGRRRDACSRKCHAGADPQRRRGRRHLCGSLRHARDGDRHHRRHARMGAPGGGDDDRLRHVGHRLRLRGGHRPRARSLRDAGRAARRPRAALRRLHQHARDAAA